MSDFWLTVSVIVATISAIWALLWKIISNLSEKRLMFTPEQANKIYHEIHAPLKRFIEPYLFKGYSNKQELHFRKQEWSEIKRICNQLLNKVASDSILEELLGDGKLQVATMELTSKLEMDNPKTKDVTTKLRAFSKHYLNLVRRVLVSQNKPKKYKHEIFRHHSSYRRAYPWLCLGNDIPFWLFVVSSISSTVISLIIYSEVELTLDIIANIPLLFNSIVAFFGFIILLIKLLSISRH
ncbi:MAG: hypothetical protein FWD97_00725 [Defluviitaleaceae bacterium]|nr:hypothetical protein [Defluviitaleaceae bacterium]